MYHNIIFLSKSVTHYNRVFSLIFRFSLLLLLASFFANCNYKDEELAVSFKLEQAGKIEFLLDNETSPSSPCIKIKNGNLYFLNRHTNSLYVYSYDSRKLQEKVSFDIEGPNSIGNLTGFDVLSNDSIMAFSHGTGIVGLFIRTDKAQKYDLARKFVFGIHAKFSADTLFPAPVVSTSSPIMFDGTNTYISGFLMDELKTPIKRPTLITINNDMNGIKYFGQYPSIYNKNNWTGFRDIFTCVGLDKNEIIASYPASDNLVLYDKSDGNYVEQKAKSSLFKTAIEPVDIPEGVWDSNKAYKHFMTTPSYFGVTFDSYNNVYYRFAGSPMTIDDFQNADKGLKRMGKNLSIIILNSKFEQVGETQIGNRYSESDFFVNEKGLHLKDRETNEDSFRFIVFKLKVAK